MWCYWTVWYCEFYNPRYSGTPSMPGFFICSFQMFGILSLNFIFQDKESVGKLVKLIDKTNGYIFAGIEASAVEFSKIAIGPVDWDYYRYPFSSWFYYDTLGWFTVENIITCTIA